MQQNLTQLYFPVIEHVDNCTVVTEHGQNCIYCIVLYILYFAMLQIK
jgi:hypothetical protein